MITCLWRRDWAEELKSGKTYPVAGQIGHRLLSFRVLIETGRAPSDQRWGILTAFISAAPKTGRPKEVVVADEMPFAM